jgi:hypothetical protein
MLRNQYRRTLVTNVTTIALAGALTVFSAAQADVIVQEGSLGGGKGSQTHEIVLDQFDSMDGALQLDFIQLDFLTSVIGGGTSNGSGVPTHIIARLDADYFLGEELLAETTALVDTIIPNNGPPVSFTVFNTDTEQVIIDQPADMDPWIGTGQITLTAQVQFVVEEDPPGSIGFGAGGTVQYTVTYDFSAACLADTNGAGIVNVDDLTVIILAWGTDDPDADTNADGTVDVDDLTAVILGWGPCP